MSFKLMITLAGSICLLGAVASAQGYVYPTLGGGQVGADMIMPEVYFNGLGLVLLDESAHPFVAPGWNNAPVLVPLTPPDAFDPCAPWRVLIGKAYNLQYGPDSAFWDNRTHPFPADCEVWFKVLSQTSGLETYYADGDLAHGYAQYAPLFGTAGSSNLWLWDKGMHHNAYAIPEDRYGRFTATYKVYVGNVTGSEAVNPNTNQPYGSSIVTYRWMVPCPWILEGDINSDCIVDFYDFALLAAQWLNACNGPDWCDNADITRTGAVDFLDLVAVSTNWLIDCQALPLNAACK